MFFKYFCPVFYSTLINNNNSVFKTYIFWLWRDLSYDSLQQGTIWLEGLNKSLFYQGVITSLLDSSFG